MLKINKYKKLLDHDGYVIIKNFIQKKYILSLKKDLSNLAEQVLKDEKIKINSKNIEVEISKYFKNNKMTILYDRAQNLNTLYSIVISKKVRNFSEKILRTKNVGIWPRPQIRIDIKDDVENTLGWHNDYMYNKGTEHSYTFWIPIINLSKEMGLLLLAKGSHKKNFNNSFIKTKKKKFNFTLPENILNKLEIIEIPPVAAGDLVLFHSKFLHAGQKNKSNKTRLTILFRMQNLGKLEI